MENIKRTVEMIVYEGSRMVDRLFYDYHDDLTTDQVKSDLIYEHGYSEQIEVDYGRIF